MELSFRKWYQMKKAMFSPKEFRALEENHPDQVDAARRYYEWERQGRVPKKRIIHLLLSVDEADRGREVCQTLDPIGGEALFKGNGLAEHKEAVNPTHYMVTWTCLPTEFRELRELFRQDVHVGKRWEFDGNRYKRKEVLDSLGLVDREPDDEPFLTLYPTSPTNLSVTP